MEQNLLKSPLCAETDLGRAIPDSPHAVSVCLPRWQDVIDYEEKAPRVLEAMAAGYPRFFFMPQISRAQSLTLEKHGREGESCLLFPSEQGALRCQQFVGGHGRIQQQGGLTAFFFQQVHMEKAGHYRRHSGDIPSSRQVEAFLSGAGGNVKEEGISLKDTLSGWSGQPSDHHFLYRNGMNGCFHLHRALARAFPGKICIQFGFPYVDVLKIQQKLSFL